MQGAPKVEGAGKERVHDQDNLTRAEEIKETGVQLSGTWDHDRKQT